MQATVYCNHLLRCAGPHVTRIARSWPSSPQSVNCVFFQHRTQEPLGEFGKKSANSSRMHHRFNRVLFLRMVVFLRIFHGTRFSLLFYVLATCLVWRRRIANVHTCWSNLLGNIVRGSSNCPETYLSISDRGSVRVREFLFNQFRQEQPRTTGTTGSDTISPPFSAPALHHSASCCVACPAIDLTRF